MHKYYIFGGSSELARAFINKISSDDQIIIFSKKDIVQSEKNITTHKINEYSTDIISDKLIHKDQSDITVIFFNGISEDKAFFNIDDSDIDTIMNVNLIIPLKITQLFLKTYLSNRINFVYMSSTRALKGDKGIAIYSASKSGLKFAAKSLALEYGKLKKYFYVISLGLFNYGLINHLDDKTIQNMHKRAAIGKYVDINELINTVLFIKENSSLTGSVINCDNGYH